MSSGQQDKLMGRIGEIQGQHSLGGDTTGRIGGEEFLLVHSADVDTSDISQQIANAAKDLTPEGISLDSDIQIVNGDSQGPSEDQLAKALVYTIKSFDKGEELDPNASLAGTEKGKALLAAMATLCRQLGIKTIAEMVEDEEMKGFLAECGIDYGQGWHFGKTSPEMPTLYQRM